MLSESGIQILGQIQPQGEAKNRSVSPEAGVTFQSAREFLSENFMNLSGPGQSRSRAQSETNDP